MKADARNDDVRKKVLDAMRGTVPEFFRIKDQNILSPKTIYNLLSQGKGPPVANINGGKYLERDSFFGWLDARSGWALKRGRKLTPASRNEV